MEPEIKFGLGLPTSFSTPNKNEFDRILSYVLEAEKGGFDLVTIADHVFIRARAINQLIDKDVKIGYVILYEPPRDVKNILTAWKRKYSQMFDCARGRASFFMKPLRY